MRRGRPRFNHSARFADGELDRLIDAAGLTKTELANRAGCALQTITRASRGATLHKDTKAIIQAILASATKEKEGER